MSEERSLEEFVPEGLKVWREERGALLREMKKWSALPHPPAKCKWKGKVENWVLVQVQYSDFRGIQVWDTVADAAERFGIAPSNIATSASIFGRTAGGFRWFRIPRKNWSCTACAQDTLPADAFYWGEDGRRITPCKECSKAAVAKNRRIRKYGIFA